MARAIVARRKWRWDRLMYSRALYLAVGAAVAVSSLALYNDQRGCHRRLRTVAHDLEHSVPPDPTVIKAAYEQLSEAADLCRRGDDHAAKELLASLREAFGG